MQQYIQFIEDGKELRTVFAHLHYQATQSFLQAKGNESAYINIWRILIADKLVA